MLSSFLCKKEVDSILTIAIFFFLKILPYIPRVNPADSETFPLLKVWDLRLDLVKDSKVSISH